MAPESFPEDRKILVDYWTSSCRQMSSSIMRSTFCAQPKTHRNSRSDDMVRREVRHGQNFDTAHLPNKDGYETPKINSF